MSSDKSGVDQRQKSTSQGTSSVFTGGANNILLAFLTIVGFSICSAILIMAQRALSGVIQKSNQAGRVL